MTELAPRPQPLGVLPWPAGMLLLPDVAGAAELAQTLLRGELPESWPAAFAFLEAALSENPAQAAQMLAGDDLISQYNRAVLVGGDGVWEAIDTAATGELSALTAMGMYTVGLRDDAPEVGDATAEIEAMVRSARASAALERSDAAAALVELEAGIAACIEVHPILAATLALTCAQLLRDDFGDPMRANDVLDTAIKSIGRNASGELRGELHVARGLVRQELGMENKGFLLPAVNDFTEAAKFFREESDPEMFAMINHQLALAYLVMPMSSEGDRIRVGVAVNSLRAALRVYTPESHLDLWSSTQLNLANALQYLPSVHQEENLKESVDLYEELLQHRNEATDPLGVARILANQGNALGHLGVFEDAEQRLSHARTIFEHFGDAEALTGVDEILSSIRDAQAGG